MAKLKAPYFTPRPYIIETRGRNCVARCELTGMFLTVNCSLHEDGANTGLALCDLC